MDDLEAKLRELQQRQAAHQDEAADAAHKAAEQEAAIESLLQQILDGEARERLTRIRMSRPELADALSRQLIALAQSGRLEKRLTDVELRAILARLSPPDRDIKITRK